MLQIDGSFHDWLGDGENLCMINITDDATSACMPRFDARETIEAVCRRLWRWMRTHGVPKSVYADGRNMCHVPAGGRDNFFTAMCPNGSKPSTTYVGTNPNAPSTTTGRSNTTTGFSKSKDGAHTRPPNQKSM